MTEKDIRAEIAEMQSGNLNARARELSNWLQGDKKTTFDELMYYLSLHRQLISVMSQGRMNDEPEPAVAEIRKPDLSFQLSKPAQKRF